MMGLGARGLKIHTINRGCQNNLIKKGLKRSRSASLSPSRPVDYNPPPLKIGGFENIVNDRTIQGSGIHRQHPLF